MMTPLYFSLVRTLGMAVITVMLSSCAGHMNRLPPPTLAEIVQLSRDKTPPDEIIKRLRESRAIYAVPASQLAQLHDQGVADMVLDYMQATYLEEVRREEAFRQWQSGWPWGPGYGWYGSPGWRRPYW